MREAAIPTARLTANDIKSAGITFASRPDITQKIVKGIPTQTTAKAPLALNYFQKKVSRIITENGSPIPAQT